MRVIDVQNYSTVQRLDNVLQFKLQVDGNRGIMNHHIWIMCRIRLNGKVIQEASNHPDSHKLSCITTMLQRNDTHGNGYLINFIHRHSPPD